MDADLTDLTTDAGKIATAISFLASVIKSGEPWTPGCAAIVSEALDALDRLSRNHK